MEISRKALFLSALPVVAIAVLLSPVPMARAADVYDDKANVIIEKVSEDDIPRLIELLGEGDTTARFKAKGFLLGFGEEAVPGLVKALDNGLTRYEAIDVLGGIKDPRAIPALFEYVDDNDPDVSIRSRQALIGMGERAAQFILDRLKEKEKVEASAGILSQIGRIKGPAKRLKKLLSSSDAEVRGAAVYVFGEWRDAGSAKHVEALLADKDKTVREKAAMAYLKVTRDYDQEVLAPLLKDESPTVRALAARLLGEVRGAGLDLVSVPLLDAAKEENAEVRRMAVYAAAVRGVPGSRPILVGALDDPDHGVRLSALFAIEELRAEEAAPYIMDMFREGNIKDKGILIAACDALYAIGRPVDISPLLPYLALAKRSHPARSLLKLIVMSVVDENRAQAVEAIEKYSDGTPDSEIKALAQDAIASILKK